MNVRWVPSAESTCEGWVGYDVCHTLFILHSTFHPRAQQMLLLSQCPPASSKNDAGQINECPNRNFDLFVVCESLSTPTHQPSIWNNHGWSNVMNETFKINEWTEFNWLKPFVSSVSWQMQHQAFAMIDLRIARCYRHDVHLKKSWNLQTSRAWNVKRAKII